MVLIACFEHTTILYERIILPIKLNQQLVPHIGFEPIQCLLLRRQLCYPVTLMGYLNKKMLGSLTTQHYYTLVANFCNLLID